MRYGYWNFSLRFWLSFMLSISLGTLIVDAITSDGVHIGCVPIKIMVETSISLRAINRPSSLQ